MANQYPPPQIFLTTAELAERWRMSPRTLEGWRDKGIGVPYRRIGSSRILYAIADVEEFEQRTGWVACD